ncbi:polycystic kidney disease protein 1-like 3 isoform X6 [Anabas testudineus]|uniref:polycystic kidney disease protein 1-like 3 isoform X6 n=1 Tax=Anabas testudineus TaxID=64144 RepID=UPI000E4624AB|nr:polycystic kidney disease protein 1-like 3 isoform X6 [Anabas testudineus]
MDLGSLYVSVSVIMACLLGAARTSPNDNNKCCPKIAGRDLTKDPPEDCFKVDGRFRYACKEGFVRKAGTSDLIKCSESNGSLRWTSASLQCIPDPKRTKPQPPQSTVTTGYSHIPPDVTTTSISSTITDPKRTKPQPPQSTVTTGYSHIPPDVTTTGISSTITASTSLQMTHSASISDSAITQTNSAEPTSSSQQYQDAPDPSQVPEEVTKVLTTAKTEHTASASTTSNSSNAWRHGTSDYGQQDGPSTSQADQMVAVAITCVSLAIICTLVGFYCYRRRRNMEEEEAAERPEERVPMNGLP